VEQSTGPLAAGLAKQIVTVLRADHTYFADHDDPDPVEQWYGDDPLEEA
jgi:hypothetical protein